MPMPALISLMLSEIQIRPLFGQPAGGVPPPSRGGKK
jgi:hypothetical protein